MPYLVIVLWGEMRRQSDLARAYAVNLVTDQVLFILIFFLLSGLSNLVTDGNFDQAARLAFLVGFLTWRVGAGAMEEMVESLADDAEWGTLEQVWLGSRSPTLVVLARSFNLILYYSLRITLMGSIILLLLRVSVFWSPGALLIYALTLLGMVGVGLALSGLHLVYKNVQFLGNAVGFALFFVTGVISSFEGVPGLYLLSRCLPLAAGIDLLRAMLAYDVSLPAVIASPVFKGLLLNSFVYLALGLAVWAWARRRAASDGSLAHY